MISNPEEIGGTKVESKLFQILNRKQFLLKTIYHSTKKKKKKKKKKIYHSTNKD
ncbi:hypothetical protein Hdeb2414_s0045g00744601 [Helianthus debilis subsp. tardiflorus]